MSTWMKFHVPQRAVEAVARENYRRGTKFGEFDSDVLWEDVPYETRETLLCDAESDVLIALDAIFGMERTEAP